MSTTARPTDLGAALVAGGKAAPAFEPRVRGESNYDRVSSMLMAVVVGALLIVGWLYLIYLTNRAYGSRVPAPIEIVEVAGGGSLDGHEGGGPSTGEADAVEGGGDPSNNVEDASAFAEAEPAAVEQTASVVLDAMADAADPNDMEADLPEVGSSSAVGGFVASGKARASRLGNGGRALGLGAGNGGGVRREERWKIEYPPGQTPEEYARQLDFFGVEMGLPSGRNTVQYVAQFSSTTPQVRSGLSKADDRFFILPQGRGRRAENEALIRRAGVDPGTKPIFQFYPDRIVNALAQLEVRFKGRQPAEIRQTRFIVVTRGNGYEFVVQGQDPLKQ